jgi:hypothetical protein
MKWIIRCIRSARHGTVKMGSGKDCDLLKMALGSRGNMEHARFVTERGKYQ